MSGWKIVALAVGVFAIAVSAATGSFWVGVINAYLLGFNSLSVIHDVIFGKDAH